MNQNNLDYIQKGNYFFPALTVESPKGKLGKYGSLRRTFLKEHRPGTYSGMKLSGILFSHLLEIDKTAQRRLEQMMKSMLEKDPAPDKIQFQMEWVRHINAIKSVVEEIILQELIYT